jgi:hypothetical protein
MGTKMEKEKNFFTVKTQFIIEGEFYVKASNKEVAKDMIEDQCWIEMNNKICSSIPIGEIDWAFSSNANKVIKNVVRRSKK